MRHPLALAAALLVAGGALTACGDDDEPTTSTEDTAPAEMGSGGGEGETVTVDIGDFVYDPEPVQISAGQTVVWENVHDQAHTATGNGDLDWNTGNLAPGDTSDPVTFEEPGTYSYICALHPFMEGTVEVSA